MALITMSEAVSKYHVDKLADQVAQAILRECLKQDRHSHVAVNVIISGTHCVLAGEIKSKASFDRVQVAKQFLHTLYPEIDYEFEDYIRDQSPEIDKAVIDGGHTAAGDQGVVVGYYTDETPYGFPFAYSWASLIIRTLESEISDSNHLYLKGDAKALVVADGYSIKHITVSACYKDGISLEDFRKYVKSVLLLHLNEIRKLPDDAWDINPSGEWHLEGSRADTGLVGRKLAADLYGTEIPVGGGAITGKDPSKVDFSGNLFARYVARDLASRFGLSKVLVKASYSIGRERPIAVKATADGQDVSDIASNYDWSVDGMTKELGLNKSTSPWLAGLSLWEEEN